MTIMAENRFDLEGLRRVMLRFGVGVLFSAFCFFPVSDDILKWFKGLTGVFLAGFGIADGFFAVVKISLAVGFITVLPYLFYHIILF